MAATVTEISLTAGVSKALVSRLINEDPTLRISEEKRNEILRICKKLGGVKKPNSRGLVRQARNIVIPCIGREVFDELQAHFESDFFRSLKQYLSEKKFRLSVSLHDKEEKYHAIEDLVNSPKYCSALLLIGEIEDKKMSDIIRSKKFPHISTNLLAERFGLNCICENSRNAMYASLECLSELGHKRIGFLGRHSHHYYPVFMATKHMGHWNHDVSWDCVSPRVGEAIPPTPEGWREAACRAFGEWLDKGGNATAMICHNDYGALGAIDAMRKRGLEPGKDISLIGAGNFEKDSPDAILTTFSVSFDNLAKCCADLLFDQIINGQKQIANVFLPMEFIRRKTVGPVKE